MAVPLRRGSMMRSVMYQPTAMMKSVEAAVKYQLQSGFTMRAGAMICAADWVKPWSNGSSEDGRKFALKPPDTPANAAAMPATGCRPAAAKIAPPSGITST
jgi:hypothetical protein